MDLESFVEDYLNKNSSELLGDPEGKTGKINENLLPCHNHEDFIMFYNHLLAKGFYAEEKLQEIKEFFYAFVIRERLKQSGFDDFELVLDDLNEIRRSCFNFREIQNWIFEKMTLKLYKAQTIEDFQEFLKKLLIFASRTGFRPDSIYEIASGFGSSLVLKFIMKTRRTEEIIEVLEKLEEFEGLNIIRESFIAPIITGIVSKINLLRLSYLQNLSESSKKIIEKVIKLLPSDSKLLPATLQILSNPVLYKSSRKERISNFSFLKLEKGPQVCFFSSSRARLTWQFFHPSSDFRFESFIVKQYEFTDPGFEEKIEAEIKEAELFRGFRGFSQLLLKEKSSHGKNIIYKLCFSACRRVEKESLTEKHLHEILDTFFFLYRKNLRARLLDTNMMFVDENGEFVVTDFSLVNFNYSPGYSTKFYDVHGDFMELPKVNKKFLSNIFKIVEGLTGNLKEDSQKNIKARLDLNLNHFKPYKI